MNMKNFVKIIMLLVICIFSVNTLVGQDTMDKYINIGIKSESFIYVDTMGPDVQEINPLSGRLAVFHKFTITKAMDVTISHCGSEIPSTNIYVKDEHGSYIVYGVFSPNEEACCENIDQVYLPLEGLLPGTYYIISEGYQEDGELTITIRGDTSPPSELNLDGGKLAYYQKYEWNVQYLQFGGCDHKITVNFDILEKGVLEYGYALSLGVSTDIISSIILTNKLTGEIIDAYKDHSAQQRHHRFLEFFVNAGEYSMSIYLKANMIYDYIPMFLYHRGADSGGTTPSEPTGKGITTEYAYSIRSWTKSISSPLFNQILYYNEQTETNKPQYGGNISAMEWNLPGEGKERVYNFEYDDLSRLTCAGYLVYGSARNNYSTAYSYDKHGNMLTTSRYGKTSAGETYGLVDNLTMAYNGNQLVKVKDTGVKDKMSESADFIDHTEGNGVYTYNKNGAMDKDTHKGITGIQYNSLNLPVSIEIDNGSIKGRTKYIYSASGAKLQVTHETDMNPQTATVMGSAPFSRETTNTKVTDYVGNKIYEDGVLKKILVDGGYIDMETGEYHFYIQDHLGNNRVVAKADGTVVQKNHYYPFGMEFAENSGDSDQPYKYNGKELDKMHGLNMYDYSARYYEPAIGRFTSMDPHAENYYNISPYAYVTNNPINFIDPNGCDTIGVNNDNEVVWEIKAEGPDVVIGSTNEVEVTPSSESGDDESSSVTVSVLPSLTWKRNVSSVLTNRGPGQSGRIDGLGAMSPEFLILSAGRGLLIRRVSSTVAKSVTTTSSSALTANSGRIYGAHVLQRMGERGITKKMAEAAITKGARYYDPKNNTINYVLKEGFASGKDLLVGVNNYTGKVTTVIRGSNLVNKRFVPL